jgi:hypothetical protein
MSLENYCTRGIGFATDDPICHACTGGCKEKRVLSGGPDIAKEIMGHSAHNTSMGLCFPDSIKSKQDLSEYLSKIFKRGTPEYQKAYAEYSGSFEMAKH